MFNFLRRSKASNNQNDTKLLSSIPSDSLNASPNQSPVIPRRRNRNTCNKQNFNNKNPNNNNTESNLFINKKKLISTLHSPQNEKFPQNFHQNEQNEKNINKNDRDDDFESRNRNFEDSFLNSNSSRNEFVDLRKRSNRNAADDINHPTTHNFVTSNDFNSIPSSPSPSPSPSITIKSNENNNLINNFNKNTNYCENFNKLDNFLNSKRKKLLFNNNKNKNHSSVVDDFPLPIDKNTNNTNSEIQSKKKSVKFFNPIDKSRDFLNNIMAKGRNRHKNNQNNNQHQQDKSLKHKNQNQSKNQVIMPKSLPEYQTINKNNQSKLTKTNNNNNNNNQQSMIENNENIKNDENNNVNNDLDKNIGYQITKSKNSPDIFKKVHQQNSIQLESDVDDDIDDIDSDDDDDDDDENHEFICQSQSEHLIKNEETKKVFDGGDGNGSDTNITTNCAKANNWIENRNRRKIEVTALKSATTEATPTPTTTTTTHQRTEEQNCANSNDWIENRNRRKREIEAKNIQQQQPQKFTDKLLQETSTTEIFKPKSILKNAQNYQQQQRVATNDVHNDQLNDNLNNSSVKKSLSNETDHQHKNSSNQELFSLIKNDDVDKLSELAECDRDRFIDKQKTTSNSPKMGQSQAKPPGEEAQQRTRSRSISPPSTCERSEMKGNNSSSSRPPIITEPISPSSSFDKSEKTDDDDDVNIPLPKITIADYSKSSSVDENSSPTESEPEIFYEFETPNFLHFNHHPPPPIPPPKYPSPTTFLEDIVEEDENENENDNSDEDEDDWHFVEASTLPKNHLIDNDDNYVDDSIAATGSPSNKHKTFTDHSEIDSGFESSPSKSKSPEKYCGKVLVLNSCDLVDENNCNYGKNDFLQTNNEYENIHRNLSVNHIVIDSISLPDVVIESKLNDNNEHLKLTQNESRKLEKKFSIPKTVVNPTSRTNNDFNQVNKSKSTGSVHFIPIQIDDSADEDEDEDEIEDELPSDIHLNDLRESSTNDNDSKEKRDLINQEASFNSKIEEAQKAAYHAEQKSNDLQVKINSMEIDLSTKSWNIERLEAELEAVYKEDDSVRKRLKFLEKEKENIKQNFDVKEDELNTKYENLEIQYNELEMKYQKLRTLASSLQTQLALAQSDADECRNEKHRLCEEKDYQLKMLEENLQKGKKEKIELEVKWHKEFEILRNQNQDREDNLLMDCEWQLRKMQKNCKDKIDNAEKDRNESYEKTIQLEGIVAEKSIEEKRFKTLQAEVRQLRGLTNDQRTSLVLMNDQIIELKAELEASNEELEEQIDEVRKIKITFQNELDNKDRETVQKIYDAIQETADMWENKLLTEMTRLTNELDTVHGEERLDDMNKLATEHIEEIRALTSRYIENETELRNQVKDLKERMNNYSDVAFNTRMTLDRADRDYQMAMSREEEKKELIIEQMKKEAELEKAEMEEKFRKRLGQVKIEFAKELANTTEEITKRHRNQLEQQWEQLVAEKEDALQALESRHRIRLEEQEAKLKNLEIQHQRDMKDLKNAYDMDRSSLHTRDMNNSQEIEQLHRKCRCLTNLFEEMRMRYERREPRPEDLREIGDLRTRCEAQEHDIFLLTEKLRDMQIKIEEIYQEKQNCSGINSGKKSIRKPPSKSIPTNCDVIYEENEERENSPPPPNEKKNTNGNVDSSSDEDEIES